MNSVNPEDYHSPVCEPVDPQNEVVLKKLVVGGEVDGHSDGHEHQNHECIELVRGGRFGILLFFKIFLKVVLQEV